MTWDKIEVRKVENGYIAKHGKYIPDKETVFKTFGDLVEWMEGHFDDVLEVSS